MGQVIVVGSINVDFVCRVAHLPRPGETVTGGNFVRHPGGKGANQAVAAARLGADVAFVGAVGDDELGGPALDELEAEGVDVSRAQRLPDTATGVALIIVEESGENMIAVASGANALVDGALVEQALVSGTGEFGRGGAVLTNLELPDAAVLAAALYARQAGWRLVVNPAPARALEARLLELEPLLVPNEGEALTLTGEADVEAAARALASQTGGSAVVTLGARGALVVEGGSVTRVAAPEVDVLDTTGAGDTFAGALAAQLARGSSLVEAVRFAVVAASLSVTRAGARGGMPSRAELERWRAGWDSNPGHED